MAKMVLQATITADCNGRDFAGLAEAQRIMAQARSDVEAALNVPVEFEMGVANVRAKNGGKE